MRRGGWVEALLFVLVAFVGVQAQSQELAPEPAEGGSGTSWLRVEVQEPASPFASVRWELKETRVGTVAALTRVHAQDYGEVSDVELVSRATYEALIDAASSCLEPPATEEVESGAGGLVQVRGEGPAGAVAWSAELGGAGSACLEAVRTAVLSVVQVEPYRNPYWEDGEFGMLKATASVPAWIWVDGVPTGLITPVMQFRLEPGMRRVRWVAVQGGEVREQEVSIHAGSTTVVHEWL